VKTEKLENANSEEDVVKEQEFVKEQFAEKENYIVNGLEKHSKKIVIKEDHIELLKFHIHQHQN